MIRLAQDREAMARSVLDGGVEVLTERIPGVRSAAVGIWVRQGSVHESAEEAGVSHMLEHMVFKGTETRSAVEIAIALEGLGGSLDAYTSREHTSYQARVLDEHVPEALDVLSDLVLRPRLDEDDLRLELEVVLEEIAQVEDTPDDLVFELHCESLWNGHPYGRSILGSTETVSRMSTARLQSLHRDRYTGANLVVAGAGNVDHDDFVSRVGSLFADVATGTRASRAEPTPRTRSGLERRTRESAQTHIVFGTDVPGHSHPDRYALILLSSALGVGMSSRLFQKVREELGLCYSVYTYQSFYGVSGVSGVYVGTRPGTAEKAASAVRTELERVAETGLAAEELEQIKRQVKGQVMIALESTGSRLHRLASFALHGEDLVGLSGLLERFDSVTGDDVRRVAREYFNPERQLELRLGPP